MQVQVDVCRPFEVYWAESDSVQRKTAMNIAYIIVNSPSFDSIS